jgi:hypothetical protein
LGTVPEDKHTLIGFRVVIGEMPKTDPLGAAEPALYQTNVRQGLPDIEGPDHQEPYFKGPQQFVHIPQGNRGPLYSKHNHFTSVTECPNGDLIATWHTCIGESGRELGVAASRLRYGRDQWEPASLFWDSPDRNDHGHAMWFDGKDKIYHFQGLADLSRNVALVMRTSNDSGATWASPRIIAGHGSSRMPVESVFRTKEGAYVISCDKGPNIVFVSRDQGISWATAGGSIRGKHAPVIGLGDGRLMAMGRQRDIDGKMQMSISADMGKTWEYSASEFQPVSWGQRAVLLRLKEGPILFASFCKRMLVDNAGGKQHEVSGLYAAVSFDEGKTWPHRRLVTDDGPQRQIGSLNGVPVTLSPHNSESVGYLAICQSPDGVINVLTSWQHYSFNLKWVMTQPPEAPMRPIPPQAEVLPHKETLPNTYRFATPQGGGRWIWQLKATGEWAKDSSPREAYRLVGGEGRGFYERNSDPAGFAAVDGGKGFTVEIRAQILKTLPDKKGADIELYDGAGRRYGLAITTSGIYWYEGYIQGSDFLPFAQFAQVAEGLDNTDEMHTYRLAVRPDMVAQIYRDGKLIAVRPGEYRTPRDAYIQLGAGSGAEALVDYFSYDLTGPYQPPKVARASGQRLPTFDKALANGRLANEGFDLCRRFVEGWLKYADPESGLIPKGLKAGRRDFWNAQDAGADNYPFMVLTAAITDRALFEGRMLDMLRAETKLTSRVGAMPDTYSFSKRTFVSSGPDLGGIIFGSSEYIKDGLLPLTEWLGQSPWSARMMAILDEIWKRAPVETKFGKIVSDRHEVNGEMLQALSRVYWMTGEEKYLEWAVRLGDYYLLGNQHPTRDTSRLRLRDHGCEIVSGLSELYATVNFAKPQKKQAYQKPVHEMLDRVLEIGRNRHGLFYNWINPQTGEHSEAIADTWGYNLNGFYTVYLIDKTEAYRQAVLKALGAIDANYKYFRWEGNYSADGFADSIESAINLYNHEPVAGAAKWIDSETKVMWKIQKPDGIIEGWHGDGNSARTTIMYCLWKTKGLTIEPWRKDVVFGAVQDGGTLRIAVTAEKAWRGKLIFDSPRHKASMKMPLDWPRINQFPEWFTAESRQRYAVEDLTSGSKSTVPGIDLQKGLDVDLPAGVRTHLLVAAVTK